MIEEFSFGNFWSFKEVQTLDMTAANLKSNNVLDKNNLISIDSDLKILRSKAIYGANASGKSNVIRALVTFIRIIKESVKNDDVLSLIEPFRLSTETVNEPTFFQLVFRINNIPYRYGFEATANEIKSEWLFSIPQKREQHLFIREGNDLIKINKTHFQEGEKFTYLLDSEDNEIFRKDSLFLTSLASFGFGKISKSVIKEIGSITVISGLGHPGMYGLAGESLENEKKRKFILEFLKKADTGIKGLEKVEITKEQLPDDIDEDTKKDFEKRNFIISSHTQFNSRNEKQKDIEFFFGWQESEGTQKMFELSPFIHSALSEGKTLIIDEFDSRFHPLLTKKIVELFNTKNNKNAQLIFVTHDTNLLSSKLLRRDQIDFVEKDQYEQSHLYTLVELKGIRKDASFEKDYIQGKYGAIPFLGQFESLLNV